jgi:hypothetical protein
MNNVVKIKKETKPEAARWLVEKFGGQWDDSFLVNPGSTITGPCLKYVKQLVEDHFKKESVFVKTISELRAHGVEIESITFPNGYPQINLK